MKGNRGIPPSLSSRSNDFQINLAQTRWPVKTLKPGSPLFTYEGAEDQNFTIPKTRAGLYWFEIKSMEPAGRSPGTVLLYATSSALDHVSGIYAHGKEHRHRTLRFQRRRSKRRLTISWGKRYRYVSYTPFATPNIRNVDKKTIYLFK